MSDNMFIFFAKKIRKKRLLKIFITFAKKII
jgi:hypothetical protein